MAADTTATLFLPAASLGDITESGKPLAKARGVQFLRMEGDRAVLAIEPGNSRFVSRKLPVWAERQPNTDGG